MKSVLIKPLAAFIASIICITLFASCEPAETSDGSESSETSQTVSEKPTESQDFSEVSNTSDGETSQPVDPNAKNVGKFTTQDVYGKTVTNDIFGEHELTMVNVFATWCSPCVAEMPDLEKLHQQMKDRGVGVVGVVLDVLNEKGEIVDEDLKRAQLLVENTGVTYPILLPDVSYFGGRLTGIEALPETFFVDKNGNIVGESYSGSGGLEDWLEVVERELANLKGN